MKTLFIDGNNLVHRVFWISKNQPNFNTYFHVYLFLNSVKTYTEQYSPDNIFCVWDERPEHQVNARKELSDEYKLTRDKEKGAEVHTQNNNIKELLCSLGIKNVFPEKYEADDDIAILHNHFTENEIVDFIKICKAQGAIFVINDLERNAFAHYAIKLLTRLFSKSYLVKNDAPLSVLRGFKTHEWKKLIQEAGAKNYSVNYKWAFRHEVIIYGN
jgi:hypothetical protein